MNVPYPMVRAMLNYKLSAAKEKSIRLRLHVGIPEGLALPEFDLTVILGNLVDNAVEACMTVEKDNRYIGLNLFYKPDYLIIQTENPVSEASEPPHGNRMTTKPDAENHGYGLRNMEYLARKHNGFMKTSRENGIFKADVALLTEPGRHSDNTPSSL
ncbi:MAG TPA: ATP-binding protein [Patescibacteria group bacterium]|nr:ATP-binding protein [Patescibacteria group bacterium]